MFFNTNISKELEYIVGILPIEKLRVKQHRIQLSRTRVQIRPLPQATVDLRFYDVDNEKPKEIEQFNAAYIRASDFRLRFEISTEGAFWNQNMFSINGLKAIDYLTRCIAYSGIKFCNK